MTAPEPKLGFAYEVLDAIRDEDGSSRLLAGFTPNNGIRVTIENDDIDGIAAFDFTTPQALAIGSALVRWARLDAAVNTDLLAALKGMVAEFDKISRYGSPIARDANEAMRRAHAAIAKAEARS